MALWAKETFINSTKGHCFGESEYQECFTDDRGKLFKYLQREYGRCSSKVYREINGKDGTPVGWVFEKLMVYEDYRGRGEQYYTREVWVELFDGERCDWNKDEAFHCEQPGRFGLDSGQHSCSKHVSVFAARSGKICVTA